MIGNREDTHYAFISLIVSAISAMGAVLTFLLDGLFFDVLAVLFLGTTIFNWGMFRLWSNEIMTSDITESSRTRGDSQ